MSSEVKFGQAASVVSRGPSPIIWRDCPVEAFAQDPSKGIHQFEDFRNSLLGKETANGTDFTSSVGRIDGDITWYAFVETTKLVDLAIQASDIGELQFLGDTSDQDVNCIVSGDNVIGAWRTPKVGEPQKFWFEARFKVSVINDADLGIFIGLAQPGEAANAKGVFDGDAAALGAVDYVGFAILEGDGNAIIAAYNEAGAGTAQSNAAGAIAADTYIRVGFKVVNNGKTTEIRFFVDGVDLGSDAAVNISNTNVNWPGDTDMAVTVTLLTGSGGGSNDALTVDWVRIAQEF